MASPNTFYYLTADAYLNEENLYLLVNVYEDDWLHSEILVLDVNNDMKLTRQYRLDEGIFAGKLCASNDYLYAFVPQINSIRRYPLK